ncbi:Fic family protein [Streptomyces microflavus]|uniref:Fic family protein n=1 Tax=Streptomyces microflavus TaxID=1919 RepID=UPI002E123520|nr:Fic family protein [Streptomyces microflavus]
MLRTMEANRFKQTPFGQAAKRPGDKWAFTYYHPSVIPRKIDLDANTVLALSEADSALGLLNGLAQLITDPQVLLGPFITTEALASSRIEGTKASLSEVLQAEGAAEEKKSDDVAEVERYLTATYQGLELVKTLPISQRLIKAIHKTLMSGVRGEERMPGEFRSTPVWVGAADDTPDTARFVPPLPEHLLDLLGDWEDYVNNANRVPTLIKSGLMHYQFETIHPFLDGNGRIGRLLVGLLLLQENRLHAPLLYLSGYLESHRREYYERLQAVREEGEIQQWLQFFLVAVRRQSEDAVSRASGLVKLRERYYRDSQMDRSRVAALIPMMFSNPFLHVRRVQRELDVTAQGARNLLERASEKYSWLAQAGTVGRGGMTLWVAEEIFSIIDRPTAYSREV